MRATKLPSPEGGWPVLLRHVAVSLIGHRRDDEIPFGTFLCLAIRLVFLYRDVLLG
jgi:hypothetical protein